MIISIYIYTYKDADITTKLGFVALPTIYIEFLNLGLEVLKNLQHPAGFVLDMAGVFAIRGVASRNLDGFAAII